MSEIPRLTGNPNTTALCTHRVQNKTVYSFLRIHSLFHLSYIKNMFNLPVSKINIFLHSLNGTFVVHGIYSQEAQLLQRNSASAAHMEGGGARPSSPLPRRPLWLHLCVWSNPKPTTNVRQACRPLSAL